MGRAEGRRSGRSYGGETDTAQVDAKMEYRAEQSELEDSREEGKERGSVGSYSTTTRSDDPKTTPESTESRELSPSPVPHRQDRTS